MVLKRPGDPETPADPPKRVRIQEPPNPAAGPSSTTFTTTSGTRREFQGQSKEGGLHSIDSDDEEEYNQSKKVELLNDDDIEGEEAGTIQRDGEIQITPFNLKDEQEDGSFAKDGSFVWNKKKDDEANDRWLEDIDWGKVKERSEAEKDRRDAEDEKEEQAEANYDEMESFEAMLALLKPQESVARALRRLGGGKKTSAQRLKEKKRIKEGQETEEEKSNRLSMEKLTGLADSILTRSGHMEIYEETFESIGHKIKKFKEENAPKKTEIPADVDDDEALDMFMASGEEPKAAFKVPENPPTSAPKATKAKTITLEAEVQWEFKWKNATDSEVHGPHKNSEMIEWQGSGFFDKGVFVRKLGTQGDFHDVKRIDFDLYT